MVHHPDPGGRAVVKEYLRDLLSDADGSSGLFDPLLEGACDPGAATLGEPSALEVVGDNHRVHGEGRTGRRQPIVAPLTGQDGLELGGADVGVKVRLRRTGGCSSSQTLGESEQ